MTIDTRRVTQAAVAEFLRQRFDGACSEVRLLSAGEWSMAYAFLRDGARWVVRWSDVAGNFARDAYAAHFAREGLPVPAITEFARGPLGYYAIAPFVPGVDFESLAPAQLEALLPALLALFRALRRVDLSGTSGYGIWNGEGHGLYPSWQAFLHDDQDASEGSMIRGWRARLAASPLGIETYDALRRQLTPLIDRCPNERHLVHADLLHRNVLAADGEITGVLDWGSSFYGDPLWDLAWFAFYEPWYPDFTRIGLVERLLTDFAADPAANTTDIELRLRCYHLAIGLDSMAYNAWQGAWPRVEEATERTLALLR